MLKMLEEGCPVMRRRPLVWGCSAYTSEGCAPRLALKMSEEAIRCVRCRATEAGGWN